MNNKISIWIYFLGMISSLFNAYLEYKSGNIQSSYAWVVASLFSSGALGAHLKIKDIENKK